MKFFRSIRWRFLSWSGLLLVVVLAGFGFTAWHLLQETQQRRLDQELEERLSPVAGMVHPPGSARPQQRRPPPGGGRPAGPPEPAQTANDTDTPFRLPQRAARLFEGERGAAFYYVVWQANGHETARSASAPQDVPKPPRTTSPRDSRMRGSIRERFHYTPEGVCVLVGHDISSELAELYRFGWLLGGAGTAVLAVGLLGGWWVATRAIRPIAEISRTAERISSGDLAQRIGSADTDSELGDLARVLNGTFDRLQENYVKQAQFTADASHELRTPVSVVLSQTQSALARQRPAEEYRESLAACQRAAQRMRQLIDSLLTLARLDAAEEAQPFAICQLDRVTADAVELLRTFAAEREVMLETDLAAAPCAGNAEQLAQVVSNLVSNAIHYNRRGGTVSISVKAAAESAVLTVADSGHGISAEDLPHIFGRFYRADPARTHGSGRAGLGLAITKAIVEAHHGTIEVASELDKGSTFTVRIPE